MTKSAGLKLRPFLVPTVTPAQLAREAGCSRQYVGQVINGELPPSQRLLDAARRLRLPVDALFGREGQAEA